MWVDRLCLWFSPCCESILKRVFFSRTILDFLQHEKLAFKFKFRLKRGSISEPANADVSYNLNIVIYFPIIYFFSVPRNNAFHRR